MYRVLVADDEIRAREGVKKYLEASGIFEVDIAEDGDKAIELLNNNYYDAVIFDIMMPKVSGLEAMAEISERQIVKIILSGYNEFDFAQEAIRYGVSEFIVKPLTINQLKGFVMNLKGMIEKKCAINEKQKKLVKEIEMNKPILRERFLEILVKRSSIEEKMISRMKYYNIEFLFSHFQVAIFKIIDKKIDLNINEEKLQVYELSLVKMFNEVSAQNISVTGFSMAGETVGVVFNYNSSLNGKKAEVEDILSSVVEGFTELWEVEVYGGVGNVYEGISGIHTSYKDANKVYRWNVIEYYAPFIFSVDLNEEYDFVSNSIDEQDILMYLKFGKSDEAVKKVEDIWEKSFSSSKININSIKLLEMRILYICMEACQSVGITCNQELLNTIFDAISQNDAKIRTSAKEAIMTLIRQVGLEIGTKQKNKAVYVIEKSKKYIEENYSINITVAGIADSLGLSRNYYGKLFKQNMGTSVSNFITNVRMNKAMELLTNTNMKIYEVGDAIGFTDQHYFSTTFKQVVGVTPSEYRDIN